MPYSSRRDFLKAGLGAAALSGLGGINQAVAAPAKRSAIMPEPMTMVSKSAVPSVSEKSFLGKLITRSALRSLLRNRGQLALQFGARQAR